VVPRRRANHGAALTYALVAAGAAVLLEAFL
jgi:hypothetical protein